MQELYVTKVIDNNSMNACMDLLPSEVIEHIKCKVDKSQSVSAYLLLQFAYSKEYGKHLPTIMFSKNGKPYFDDDVVQFSISHSHDYVAVAISDTCVGVDIQKESKINTKIVNKLFSVENKEKLLCSTNKDYDYTLEWTRIESIIKCFDLTIQNVLDKSYLDKQNYTVQNYSFKNYVISVCKKK